MINLRCKSELNNFTLTELIEILYELDWNGSWEDWEEGQEPLSKDEAINYILSYVNEDEKTNWFITPDLKLVHIDVID